jgi:hypothetical protein
MVLPWDEKEEKEVDMEKVKSLMKEALKKENNK